MEGKDDALPAPKPGDTHCLRCQRKFFSVDIRRIRFCPKCTVRNSGVDLPKEHKAKLPPGFIPHTDN